MGLFQPKILLRQILAALTVSFVAISLGAAFGVMSGRGALAGILSAGVIAFITSLIGGTRIQCSGPTAPMTAVMIVKSENRLRVYRCLAAVTRAHLHVAIVVETGEGRTPRPEESLVRIYYRFSQ